LKTVIENGGSEYGDFGLNPFSGVSATVTVLFNSFVSVMFFEVS